MNDKPVAWMHVDARWNYCRYSNYPSKGAIPLYTHPVKEQTNLVKVVKDHVNDLKQCVKVFRTQLLINTANEMEVAIKELEDALESHPSKELTDEEIKSEAKYFCHNWYSQNPERLVLFARAILRKAQEK